jgi:hypothetical protein
MKDIKVKGDKDAKDKDKRQYLIELSMKVKTMETTQGRDQTRLGIMNNSVSNASDLYALQLNTLVEAIRTRKIAIDDLHFRIKEIEEGGEFEKEKSVAKHVSKITSKNVKEKVDSAKVLYDGKEKRKKVEYSEDKQEERDFKYYYKHFCKIEETIPEYMLENLKNMPNNKGYIWRKMWLFGELPEERCVNQGVNQGMNGNVNQEQPTLVMFERARGVLLIHEYDKHEYRLFEKDSTGKRKFILKRPRYQKKQGVL